MLATRLEDPRRLAEPRYIAEPKLDGQRAQLHVRDHRTVHAFSRPGRELIRLPPTWGSRNVNGYVKAALALEAVRRKREARYERAGHDHAGDRARWHRESVVTRSGSNDHAAQRGRPEAGPLGCAPCPLRIRLQSRGAPARLEPRGLLGRSARRPVRHAPGARRPDHGRGQTDFVRNLAGENGGQYATVP